MSKQMTDNEIIKALERCGYHNECCYCNSVEECGSKRKLVTNTLDLIKRLKAENKDSLLGVVRYLFDKCYEVKTVADLNKKGGTE